MLRKAAERLVDQLSSAASYNDKGYLWTGHSAAQSEALRDGWRREFQELLAVLEPAGLPPSLAEALRSGAAAEDWSGDYVIAAREWLTRWPEA
jgi:hypothetical protein